MSKYSDALAIAAPYCSTSEHCRFDILKKISRYGLSDKEKKELIDQLEKEGFFNEERFVKAFVNDCFHFNKWGRLKIRYKLKQKEIKYELIDEGLAVISENDYRELLLAILKQKRPFVKSNSQCALRGKMLRFALTRGFEPHIVLSCLKELDLDEDTEDFL